MALILIPRYHWKPFNEFLGTDEKEAYNHSIQRINDSFASIEAHVWRDSFSSFHEGQWPLHFERKAGALESGTRRRQFLDVPRPARNNKKSRSQHR